MNPIPPLPGERKTCRARSQHYQIILDGVRRERVKQGTALILMFAGLLSAILLSLILVIVAACGADMRKHRL